MHDQTDATDQHAGGECAGACGGEHAATSTDRNHDEHHLKSLEQHRLEARERREPIKARLVAAGLLAQLRCFGGERGRFIMQRDNAGRGMLVPASAGALAACVLVGCVGLVVHRPLARVPENTLKFAVGVMLSAFGVFWTGEGLGVNWPGADLAIVAFAALFLAAAGAAVVLVRRPRQEVLP